MVSLTLRVHGTGTGLVRLHRSNHYAVLGCRHGDFPTLPRVQCTLDLSASAGFMDDSEEVLFANLSTSTGYPAGHYEFIVGNAGYDYVGTDVQYIFAAPNLSSSDEATPDDAFVRMDGVNDYAH